MTRRSWRRPRGGTTLVSALGAVALALVVAASWLFVQVRDADAEQSKRQDVLAAARQEAVNLTSQDYTTIDADLDRMIKSATGDLKADLDKQRATYRDTFTTNKLKAKGTATEAGLVTMHERSATVIVVVDQLVSADSTDPKKAVPPQPRRYRLELDMSLVDGTWLASGLRAAGLVS